MSALDAARAWAADDPDAETRAELEAVIAAAEAGSTESLARLETWFAGRLEFGTAGLRGPIGPGPLAMNRVLVAQAAAGLAAYLRARAPHPTVVIGYDGRRNSRVFAEDSAEILHALGVSATLMPRLLPTPVLAFAVRQLDASAGIMVTASHNPAADNGYKVYLGGPDAGSQIVPPADGEIAAEIARVAAGSIAALPRSREFAIADESIVDAYVARTASVARHTAPLRVVYTPLHGVGLETFTRVLEASGLAPVEVVAEQAEPDAAFPTVAFPNPEEPGAMDLAFEHARATGAELVIANDPDADRVAVGIPDSQTPGGWRRLSGNEVGWLLGWEAARQTGTGTLANSLVSSPALGAVAAHYGLAHVETLTGFKWISRTPELVFGYEEALGYLVNPDTVRDKDGISAALAVLSLASELHSRGASLADRLDEFATTFGGYASGQISIRVTELAEIDRMIARLRAEPPAAIAGLAVEGVDDFLTGVGDYPPGDILRYRLTGGARVIVRPSGTEPKLKCYLDAVSTVGTAAERLAAARSTIAALDAAMRKLLG